MILIDYRNFSPLDSVSDVTEGRHCYALTHITHVAASRRIPPYAVVEIEQQEKRKSVPPMRTASRPQ